MKILRYSFFLSLLFSAVVNANPSNSIALGAYYDSTGSYPLLLNSNDDGLSWTVNKMMPNLPPSGNPAIASSVRCVAEQCVVTGTINSFSNKPAIPLILTSDDQGNTWRQVKKIQTGSDVYAGDLVNTVHKDSIWMTVGSYQQLSTDQRQPWIVISEDKGITWHKVEKIKNLPIIDFGSLHSINCNAIICIAAGIQNTKPLIVSSVNGKIWENIDLPTVEFSYSTVSLGKPTFADSTIFIPVVFDHTKAAFLMSADNGKSWHYNYLTNLPTTTRLQLGTLDCNAKFCLAAAYYKKTATSRTFPLILISYDKGKNWSSIKKYPAPQPQIDEFALNRVKCLPDHCLVTGYQISAKLEKVTFVLWSIKDDTITESVVNKLPDYDYGYLNGIDCNNTTCLIAGQYMFVAPDTTFHPLILRSTDSGITWNLAKVTTQASAKSTYLYGIKN